jgi:hypothetical protein
MSAQNLQNISPLSFNSEATIAANQPVKMGAADMGIVATSANTDQTLAITLVSSVSGDAVPCQDKGIAKLQAGGTVTRGDKLMWSTGGKVVTATTGKPVIGIALESAVSSDYFRVQLTLPAITLAP